jgi:hypothetical protein
MLENYKTARVDLEINNVRRTNLRIAWKSLYPVNCVDLVFLASLPNNIGQFY